MKRFLIDDQGRTKKTLRPLYVSPTLRREMHGNEPRVVETNETEGDDLMTFKDDLPIRYTDDGFHQFRNDYKKSSVQGTHVTFGFGRSHALTSAHTPMVLQNTKGDDKMENGGNKVATKASELPTKDFKYVSLFSGIGGFEQALNKLGGECVLASEIDKYANQAYEAVYGEETIGDITKVDAKDVPDHDVLVGGFPCQAFSVAGKRGGFEDARGTLFFEMARIAAEKKPKMILAENVKGLVGHDKGKTLDTIVKTLNECGYRVDFEVLNSKYFGVPQNRERIFIVAVREDLVENEAWTNTKGSTVVPKGKRRISGYDDVKTFNFDWPKQGEVTTRLVDVLQTKVDERYYLPDEKTEKLVARLEESDKEDAPNALHNIYGGFKEGKPRVFKEESPTIRTAAGGGHLPSVLEDEPCVNSHGETKINEEGTSNAIDANYHKGMDKHGQRTHVLSDKPKYRIRKLTPLECFRLQGFDDSVHQAIVDAGISNTQQYKMAGNAVTVNVIESLGARLLTYL